MEYAKVAIIGAGPAGIGAAVRLSRLGIGPIALIERETTVGGIPARYTSDDVPTYVMWTRGRVIPGYRFAERLRKELDGADVTVHLESTVTEIDPETDTVTIVSPGRGQWRLRADAVLLACGARESSRAERGWIYGHRPSGVHFTTNLLDLAGSVCFGRPSAPKHTDAAIIGSEVMAYAAAAKLRNAGAGRLTVADDAARPRTFLPKRLFFYRWAWPRFVGGAKAAIIRGSRAVESIELRSGAPIPVGQVLITGALVPNSELLAEAGYAIDLATRRITNVSCCRLGRTSIFLAGNVLGIACSGQWAYWTGKWAAGRVARLLRAAI